MSKRMTLFENFTTYEDTGINSLLYNENHDNNVDKLSKAKKCMLKIINNELTSRQKEVIMLYYFNNMSIHNIAEQLNVTSSTISITLKRGRNKILDYLKYYF